MCCFSGSFAFPLNKSYSSAQQQQQQTIVQPKKSFSNHSGEPFIHPRALLMIFLLHQGWPDGACDDTGSDYPKTWCHFGCAVRELDPTGKFQQESATFKWNERKLRQCCTSQGFNDSLPGCRHGCKSESPNREMIASRTCRYPPPHPSKRFPNLW